MSSSIIPNCQQKGSRDFPIPFRMFILLPILLCVVGISLEMPVASMQAFGPRIRVYDEVLTSGQTIDEELFKLDLAHNHLMTKVQLHEITVAKAEMKKTEKQNITLLDSITNSFSKIMDRFLWGKREAHEQPDKGLFDRFADGTQLDRSELYAAIVSAEMNYLESWKEAKIANEKENFIGASEAIRRAGRAMNLSTQLQSEAWLRYPNPINPYAHDVVSRLINEVQELKSTPTKYHTDFDKVKDGVLEYIMNKYMLNKNKLERLRNSDDSA